LIVFVRLLGYFSQVTGKREEKISLERGSTVEKLVEILSSKYGREFREAVTREGFRGVLFVVNGKRVEKDHVLSHGDKVVISFPIGGGDSLKYFFRPKSIAVFGATAKRDKLGYFLFKNLVEFYEGTLYPVNPNEKEILGHKVYGSILDIEEEIDLALISIPRERVLDSLKDCARKGIKACVILSAGFGELEDENSRTLQMRIKEIVESSGIRVIGPNCMGIIDTRSALNASYFWDVPMEKGKVAFISQSGAYGAVALHYARNSLLRLSFFVSIGNMVDVDYVELMEYAAKDRGTDVIMLLVEGLKDGKRFLEAATKISREKPLLLCKLGRTKAGTRAAKSHTGAIAGEYRILEGVCKQCRVLLFKSVDEMLDAAQVLSTQPLPKQKGVGIITISGGPAVAVSDLCEEIGIKVPEFDPKTKERLKKFASPISAVSNPLDLTPETPPEMYAECVKIVTALDYIGGVIAINIGLDSKEFAEAFVEANKKYGKPVVVYAIDTPTIIKIFKENKIPVLNSPERCVLAFKNMMMRADWIWREVEGDEGLQV
jgi:MoaD family protein